MWAGPPFRNRVSPSEDRRAVGIEAIGPRSSAVRTSARCRHVHRHPAHMCKLVPLLSGLLHVGDANRSTLGISRAGWGLVLVDLREDERLDVVLQLEEAVLAGGWCGCSSASKSWPVHATGSCASGSERVCGWPPSIGTFWGIGGSSRRSWNLFRDWCHGDLPERICYRTPRPSLTTGPCDGANSVTRRAARVSVTGRGSACAR